MHRTRAPLRSSLPVRGWVPLQLARALGRTASCCTSSSGATSRSATSRPCSASAWAVIQPLIMMVVFSVFFGRAGQGALRRRCPTPCSPTRAWCPGPSSPTRSPAVSDSLVDHARLITKVYFPRARACRVGRWSPGCSTSPIATVVLLVGDALSTASRRPGRSLLAARASCCSPLVARCGVGLWLAAAQRASTATSATSLPFLVQVWLFATPVVLPS